MINLKLEIVYFPHHLSRKEVFENSNKEVQQDLPIIKSS